MRYYKHSETGQVYAYGTDNDRQKWGAPELVEMTDGEIHQHLNQPLPPPQAPQQVSRAQGKAALVQAGLWEAVQGFAASIEDQTQAALADIALNDTTEWQRSSPFLTAAAQSLGMTDEQIDDLFIQAAEIKL